MLKWNHFKQKEEFRNKNRWSGWRTSSKKLMSHRGEDEKMLPRQKMDSVKLHQLTQSAMNRTTRHFNYCGALKI
jgi:hypothetical protein